MLNPKNIFSFYLNSSLHVALSVVSLACLTAHYMGFSLDSNFYFFIFFSAVSGYNFIKYATVARWRHYSLKSGLRQIQVFSLISFVAACLLAWSMPRHVYGLLTGIVFLSLLYAFSFFSAQKKFRDVPILKIVWVAIVWALFTVLFPLIYKEKVIDEKTLALFVQRILFVLLLILPFEIRDLKYDDMHLKTVPRLIGVENTKKIGWVIVVLLLGIEFYFFKTSQAFVAFGVYVSAAMLLWKVSVKKSYYYTAFWVEALPIFWLLLLFFFHYIERIFVV